MSAKDLMTEPKAPVDADALRLIARLRAAVTRGVSCAEAATGCGASEASIYRWLAGHAPTYAYRERLRGWLDATGATEEEQPPRVTIAVRPGLAATDRLRAVIDGGVPRAVVAAALGCDESTIRGWLRGASPSLRFQAAINNWVDSLAPKPEPIPGGMAGVIAALQDMIRLISQHMPDPPPETQLPAALPPSPPAPPHPADIAVARLRAAMARGVTIDQVRSGTGAHNRCIRRWLAGAHPPPYRLPFLVRFLDSLEGTT